MDLFPLLRYLTSSTRRRSVPGVLLLLCFLITAFNSLSVSWPSLIGNFLSVRHFGLLFLEVGWTSHFSIVRALGIQQRSESGCHIYL